jgi:excisionase family DNA binding protein
MKLPRVPIGRLQSTEGQLEPIAVTVKTACRLTGIGATKMYELIAAGAVESAKIGNRRLLIYASLKRICQPATS